MKLKELTVVVVVVVLEVVVVVEVVVEIVVGIGIESVDEESVSPASPVCLSAPLILAPGGVSSAGEFIF